MRSRKNNKKMIVLVVMLLLLSMGIGYAYLTKILKINNTANIAKTTWDVYFENVIISEGRPVISLKPNTMFIGGNGTKEDPFVIAK